MHSKDSILHSIQLNRGRLHELGVRSLALFGSYASGNATAQSDLDFIVKLEKKTFDAYMNVKDYLETLLGKPVDLVLDGTVKPSLKDSIQKTAVYVQGL